MDDKIKWTYEYFLTDYDCKWKYRVPGAYKDKDEFIKDCKGTTVWFISLIDSEFCDKVGLKEE